MATQDALKRSFTEIVESRAGFCYNLGQVFRYSRPSQEELRAFLFSDSERFSTFHIKYKRRKIQEESGASTGDVSQPLLAEDLKASRGRDLINNPLLSGQPASSFASR